jgi:hypothetical protein
MALLPHGGRTMDLVEIEAIKRLKYKYMRCLDLKRWEELAGCFSEDATAAYSGGKYSYQGRDAILEFLRGSMGKDSFLSCHQVHHPEIELTSETTARGTWSLQDTVIETQWDIMIRGAAFYHDEYVKQDGVWLIRHTGYERLFEETLSRKDIPSLKLTAGGGVGV